jgi:PilZ domain
MAKQRQLFRIAIDRTGEVRRGNETFTCNVVDLTEKGVRLRIDGTFRLGEALQLIFPLTETDRVECVIEVTHHRPPQVGAAIVRMASEDEARLSRFIEELNALNMTGF